MGFSEAIQIVNIINGAICKRNQRLNVTQRLTSVYFLTVNPKDLNTRQPLSACSIGHRKVKGHLFFFDPTPFTHDFLLYFYSPNGNNEG